MQDPDELLTLYAQEALEREQKRIDEAIKAAADRVIARLAPPEDDENDPLLDRKEAMEEFQVPYWKIRDLQLTGRIPTFRRGKRMVARRSDIEQALREAV